jgi:hypothetical protein
MIYKYFFLISLFVLCFVHTSSCPFEEKSKLLLDHLKQPHIPEPVKKLALKGYENYKVPPLLQKLESLKIDQAPGAREKKMDF